MLGGVGFCALELNVNGWPSLFRAMLSQDFPDSQVS